MDDDWVYQDEEFDEDLPYIELQFGIEDLYMIYNSVKYRYEKMAWRTSRGTSKTCLPQRLPV